MFVSASSHVLTKTLASAFLVPLSALHSAAECMKCAVTALPSHTSKFFERPEVTLP